MSRLEGKVAVITGGNSGIGLATAQRFVSDGAYVFITGAVKANLMQLSSRSAKTSVVFRVTSDSADLDRLHATVKEQKGHIDVLFANAGVGELVPLEAITEAHFDKIFGINVKGLLFTVQKALPLFQDGGSIILNASIAHLRGSRHRVFTMQPKPPYGRSSAPGLSSETTKDPRQCHQSWND